MLCFNIKLDKSEEIFSSIECFTKLKVVFV